MFKSLKINHITSGFVGMMIGFTSSIALIFQAARNAGANDAQISSWLLGLGLSIATCCICLSLRYRMPILVGWSTPGAALLITSLSGASMSDAIGAFIVAACLTIISGYTGLFERMMRKIPSALTSAMLAGILVQFGMNVFTSMNHQLLMGLGMFTTYLVGRRFFPKLVIPMVLIVGITIAKSLGLLHFDEVQFSLSSPVLITPSFSWATLISIGLPLFIVTMTSQNLPGVATLKVHGYEPPVSPIIGFIGLITLIFAPLGCFSINLAAITAPICAGEECDSNPKERYKSCIIAGFCWIIFGFLGATIVALFSSLPQEMLFILAGLALINTIAASFKMALEDKKHQEPAIITALVSASGFSILGIGSAFWGLVAGLISMFVLNRDQKFLPAKSKLKKAWKLKISDL